MKTIMKKGAEAVCLIKPQFEAGKEKVGKKGVVRDPAVHLEVIQKVIGIALENGFKVKNLDYSPIKGPEGNIEYLIHIENTNISEIDSEVSAEKVVELAHSSLKGE
jgi:23S rRNA (cytidine1920-2'-O)/16S rRNA (cytidine1409-2'-O)-methyltransferase